MAETEKGRGVKRAFEFEKGQDVQSTTKTTIISRKTSRKPAPPPPAEADADADADPSPLESPPKTGSKTENLASTGLTTKTLRIGINRNSSSPPSPTRPSSMDLAKNITLIPPNPNSPQNGAKISGFAKFSTLSTLSSTENPDASNAKGVDDKSGLLSFGTAGKMLFGSTTLTSFKSTASSNTFGYGSSKTFGTGSSTFGTGAAVFGTGTSSFSSSKMEKNDGDDEDQDNNNDEDDATGHENYLASLKTKYEIQEVVTGEEGESLVASLRCKLYHSPPSLSAWKERGLGILKLSRMSDGAHRIVMRSDVVRKVILNVRVLKGMPLVVRNERYIEFYAGEVGDGDEKGLVKFLVRCKNAEAANDFYGHVKAVCGKVGDDTPPCSSSDKEEEEKGKIQVKEKDK